MSAETRAFSLTDPTDCREDGMETASAGRSSWTRPSCPLLVRITAAKRRLIAIVRSAIKQELHAKLTEITAAAAAQTAQADAAPLPPGRPADGGRTAPRKAGDAAGRTRRRSGRRSADNSTLHRSISPA